MVDKEYKERLRETVRTIDKTQRPIKLTPPGSEVRLTPKQELFCIEYTDPEGKGYSRAWMCYKLVYSMTCKENTARCAAHDMLKLDSIQKRIAELTWGGDPKYMRRHLAGVGLRDLLIQRRDLPTLKGAVDIVHKLDGDYKDDENKVIVNVINFKDMLNGDNSSVQSGLASSSVSVGNPI